MNQISRRLAAVAFADVAGWTRLVAADEMGALRGWRTLRDRFIEPKIREHGGRLVDSAGDAVFVEFPSAVEAMGWALDLQSRPAEIDTETRALRLRVGINVGDLLVDEQRLVGDEVNVASRIHQLAAPDEIVVTDAVRQHVAHRLAVSFLDLGERQLKNLSRPVRLYLAGAEPAAAAVGAEARPGPARACLAVVPPVPAGGDVPAWQAALRDAVQAHGGRWAEPRTPDAQLALFPQVRQALQAAFAFRRATGAPAGESPALPRLGLHAVEGWAATFDTSGAALALALAGSAEPGAIVGSSAALSDLTPMLDADCEDIGERLLRGFDQPVRAYRLMLPRRPGDAFEDPDADTLQPTLAVIPFSEHGRGHAAVGEILADEIIGALSRSAELNVVSRLSTTGFRGRGSSLRDVAAHLRATYVLSGAYRATPSALMLNVELAEPASERVIWAQELRGSVAGIVDGRDEIIDRIVAAVGRAVVNRELERTRTQSLHTLKTGTLLIAAIELMHRLSISDFQQARELLQTVAERAPRHATPQAWLAKWHVLRVWQGWSDAPEADTRAALDRGRRALDNDSQCSLALAIDGFVHTNLLRSLDVAEQRYEQALRVNPSDALAWSLQGMLHAFKCDGAPAVRSTRRGLRLSPLDPNRYFYDVFAASAELVAGHHERAIVLAQRSLRANRMHASTFRVLAIAEWLAGRHDAARATVAELLRVEPSLTVSQWLRRSPSADFPIGRLCADALEAAGVPP